MVEDAIFFPRGYLESVRPGRRPAGPKSKDDLADTETCFDFAELRPAMLGTNGSRMAHARHSCRDKHAPVSAERDHLRRALRQRRRDLPAARRIAAADALAARLLALPFFQQDVAPDRGYVAGYWAMDGEIALHAWQMRLPRDCVYCLPVLGDNELLRFAPWRPGDPLVTNRFGIPEPDITPSSALAAADMALVAMPLVGFDANGTRLGMGGGWYDRSFAFRREAPAPPWLVGVGFDLQRVDALDAQAWDVRADVICTESSTFTTTTGALA